MEGHATVQKRPLGRSGLDVAPLVLGGNVFGWTADERASFEVLDAFAGAGFTMIDTADSYSSWVPGHEGGESETIIGRWLKRRGRRDDVLVATKCGADLGGGRRGLSANYILEAADGSLRRLQTDYIDLYQSHYPDPETPIEETLEAYGRLMKAGKVRAIGASNFTAAGLREALQAADGDRRPRYEALQPHYNLYDRAAYEGELEPVVRESGIGVIPYYGLAAGFLTGKYRSEADLVKSPRGTGIKRYLTARGQRVLSALDAVGARLNATPAQVALAWLMSRPTVTAPIASATSRAQLEELVGAASLQLDADAIATLDATG